MRLLLVLQWFVLRIEGFKRIVHELIFDTQCILAPGKAFPEFLHLVLPNPCGYL